MPVPLQRDPELTRSRLADWISASFGAYDVLVGPVTVPRTAGFSAEILLCDAVWTIDGRRYAVPLAVRVAPSQHRIFPDLRWREQVEILLALATTDVPVAPVLGYSESDGWLGAPFVVMRRVDGLVPADLPSYHREGWLAEMAPDQRRALWLGAVEALHRVHRLDVREVPAASPAPTGDLEFFADHLGFFGAERNPVVDPALRWLLDHRPPAPDRPSLLWGDARLGNIIFAGQRPVALLDWEMTDVGRPESDLAWFLHLDRHLSTGIGAPRLAGLPDRAETVAYYEMLAGRRVEHLEYFEMFAAFRFCVVTARVVRLLEESGIIPAEADFPLHRNATALLRRQLDEVSACAAPPVMSSGPGAALSSACVWGL